MKYVHGVTRRGRALVAVLAIASAACAGDSALEGDVTVFQGADVIVGDGSVISDAVLVVQDDRIAYVGDGTDAPSTGDAPVVDLSGKTIMPALINAHMHLSSDVGERSDQLQHLAYYGAGAAISLGLDEGPVGLVMRAEAIPDGARSLSAGRGITSPEPGRSEVPYWVTTEDEARTAVRELAEADVDFVKIWVDDRSGTYERLSPELYGAVIDEAHAHGLRVTAHVFTLEDAKGLLEAGVDAFAHGVRDMDVDDELVAMWRARPEVVLVPNLPGPGVAEDLSWLAGTVPAADLERMQAAQRDRPAAQEAFGIQARNLVRLSREGVTISFGTDGSSPWAVHQEMADMVRAGLTPSEVIVAATSTSAEVLRLDDMGTVAAGMSADFVVLDANPLDDITNTRRISEVYLRGSAVERDALSTRFLAAGQE